MPWTLTPAHLEDLARGATLLGTGGGGDPLIGRRQVEAAMRENGGRPVTVLDPDELDDDAFVVPTAMMGAPTVAVEKAIRGTEGVTALRALERYAGRSADATMPIECGGLNSMIPLIVAARTGLPVVDADGMGRAFPELQMETFNVYGVPGSPIALVGEDDDTAIVDTGRDTARMESLARALTVRLGGVAHIAEYAMTGAQVKRTAVPRTLSLALGLGRALRLARESRRDPVAALADALAGTHYSHLRVLFRGTAVAVEHRTEEGFTRGHARFDGWDGWDGWDGDDGRDRLTAAASLELTFQNEHLVARVDGEVRCVVPDLICVLDAGTGEPVTTEALRAGQRVTVVGISTPPLMRTPEALAVFGPACFGLDVPYRPVEIINGR
ncbi:protein of unknown function DUF917 [Actinobacteria bacterium OK074]|nr:protein of unknown function DUF917 [Actinobacteria bacterium OK074]